MGIIKTYKAFVISFGILISLSIIPSILSHPKYILLILMLGSILLSCRITFNIPIGQSVQFKVVMVLWFVFLGLSSITNLSSIDKIASSFISSLAFFVTFIIFFVVLNDYNKAYGFQSLLRLYVLMCFCFAVPAILAWTMLTFNFIDPNNWFVNIGDITSGKFPVRGDKFHVAPYYLGLVQFQESEKFTLFNYSQQLFRLSGISSESSYAALLVAPASFLVLPVFREYRVLRKVIFGVISLFLICTFSFTLFLLMYLLLFLYHIRNKNLKILMLMGSCLIFLASFYLGSTEVTSTDLLKHKFASGRLTPDLQILLEGIYKTDTIIFTENGKSKYQSFAYYLAYYTLIISTAIIALRLALSKRTYWYVGFSVLYMLGHFMKGGGPVIVFWPFFLFLTCLMGYAYKIPKNMSISFCRPGIYRQKVGDVPNKVR